MVSSIKDNDFDKHAVITEYFALNILVDFDNPRQKAVSKYCSFSCAVKTGASMEIAYHQRSLFFY